MTREAALCVVIGIATTRSWDAEASDSEMGWGQAEDKNLLLSKRQKDTGRTKNLLSQCWLVEIQG